MEIQENTFIITHCVVYLNNNNNNTYAELLFVYLLLSFSNVRYVRHIAR